MHMMSLASFPDLLQLQTFSGSKHGQGAHEQKQKAIDQTHFPCRPDDRQLLSMRSTKVVAACIFNKLQAAGLFLALDGTSTPIDPSVEESTES